MTWLARVALRLARRGGLRWLVAAALGRLVLRHLSHSAVERAAAELEAKAHQRLPAPMARALSALPPEVRNVGGSALVATRAARRTVSGGRRAGRLTRDGRAQVTARVDSAWGVVGRLRAERDDSARRLRSRYLAATVGPDAATDALLDVASPDRVLADPHLGVAEPVRPGRRRARPRRRSGPDRPSRSYRPPPKPWD